jgi:hypothetical protein
MTDENRTGRGEDDMTDVDREVFGEEMDSEVAPVVIRPDDITEAVTPKRKTLPAIKFSYKPMTATQNAKYLNRMKRAGENVEKLQSINFHLLAGHVVDGELYDRDRKKLKFDDPADWQNVPAEIIFDMVNIIVGMGDIEKEEAEELEGL